MVYTQDISWISIGEPRKSLACRVGTKECGIIEDHNRQGKQRYRAVAELAAVIKIQHVGFGQTAPKPILSTSNISQ
jgi:hypothetical protein